jgi:AbrB family looped-hinge helix DNA binding protein
MDVNGATSGYGIDGWVHPLYRARMSIRVNIDEAGRIVIPNLLREQLNIGPGDSLELEVAGGAITLRPLRATAPLTKERGVWVFRTGQPLSASVTDETLRRIRDERDLRNLPTT